MKNQKYINEIESWNKVSVGDERRIEILRDILSTSGELPRTVLYEDIDNAFKDWVMNDLEIYSPDNKKFPTMTMFSNQRFSEYSQTWKHVDENKNLLLNFKSITREINPKKGNLHGNSWNTPQIYYLIDKRKVLDDNGTESLRKIEMKQPTPIDLKYKVSIFTTSYKKVNEFNEKINELFNACQVYIFPNGHPIAMKLDNITDESSYQIDDRQFYAQSYDIIVMGYIISEDDYKVTEVPLKNCYDFSNLKTVRRTSEVEIEDLEDESKRISICFPTGINTVTFTLDEDFTVTEMNMENVRNGYKIIVNGVNETDSFINRQLKNADISIKIHKWNENKVAYIIFNGK